MIVKAPFEKSAIARLRVSKLNGYEFQRRVKTAR